MLQNVNVYDRVKSCLAGWGTVIDIREKAPYPILIKFDIGRSEAYRYDGKALNYHINPEIVDVEKYD